LTFMPRRTQKKESRITPESKVIDLHECLRYLVMSDTDPKMAYMVDLLAWRCECPDCQIRVKAQKIKVECKHLDRALKVWAKAMLKEIRKQYRTRRGPHRDGE
jgi:hypothetical protein